MGQRAVQAGHSLGQAGGHKGANHTQVQGSGVPYRTASALRLEPREGHGRHSVVRGRGRTRGVQHTGQDAGGKDRGDGKVILSGTIRRGASAKPCGRTERAVRGTDTCLVQHVHLGRAQRQERDGDTDGGQPAERLPEPQRQLHRRCVARRGGRTHRDSEAGEGKRQPHAARLQGAHSEDAELQGASELPTEQRGKGDVRTERRGSFAGCAVPPRDGADKGCTGRGADAKAQPDGGIALRGAMQGTGGLPATDGRQRPSGFVVRSR